jgi:hypothetical protein
MATMAIIKQNPSLDLWNTFRLWIYLDFAAGIL